MKHIRSAALLLTALVVTAGPAHAQGTRGGAIEGGTTAGEAPLGALYNRSFAIVIGIPLGSSRNRFYRT